MLMVLQETVRYFWELLVPNGSSDYKSFYLPHPTTSAEHLVSSLNFFTSYVSKVSMVKAHIVQSGLGILWAYKNQHSES